MSKPRNGVFAEVRQREICALLQQQGEVSVAQLCEQFSASAATIRSDLARLESEHRLTRTHGGALRIDAATHELTATEKLARNIPAKLAIARKAMDFIQPGTAVALDTGTTTMELARLMHHAQELTVITNDAEIAICLESAPAVSTFLLGGFLRKQFHCTVGASVTDALENLHCDTLFLAANGLNLTHGLSTPSLEMAAIKRKMIEISSQVILLVDKSKLDCNSFAYFAPLSDVDVIISDADIAEELKANPATSHIHFIHVDP